MKKAWLASITLFFTISVLLISSQAAYAGAPAEFAVKCYDAVPQTEINPGPKTFEDMIQAGSLDPDVNQRHCVSGLKHSSTAPAETIYWVEHEDENNDGLLTPNGVQFVDQFSGTFMANLFHLEFLMPAVVDGDGSENMQFFSGYSTDVTAADVNPQGTNVLFTDIFGTSVITLDSHFTYESAAIIDGMGALSVNEMTCYMFQEEDPVIDPPGMSTWVTKFGTSEVDLGPADVLCVMAEKLVPVVQPIPVGGEIIPIETTSLLLAGAQSFSWMIPIVVSGIGIGLFVVSRKS